MALRDTQIAVEVLETEANPNTRVTQVAVEVLETEANPNTRVSQVAIEVLEVTNLMQVAQQFVQVISNNDPVNTIEVVILPIRIYGVCNLELRLSIPIN